MRRAAVLYLLMAGAGGGPVPTLSVEAAAQVSEARRPRSRSAAQLGAGKDDDDRAVASARGGQTSPSTTSDADVGLLRALLYAYEPGPQEIRVIAVEDLGLLGDPRALNPLSQLLFDLNPAVQQAALTAVARFQYPRAEEILCNVVRHPLLPERLKIRAIEALVFQRSPTAHEFLTRVQSNASVNPPLRDAARRTLATWGPIPNR